jgi:hypothetical protein
MAKVAGGVQRRFLTVSELGQRLAVSKWTLTEWRAKNYGPGWARMGGRIVYPLTEVEQFETDLVERAQAMYR